MSAELALSRTILDLLRSLANLWTLGTGLVALAVLARFVYTVFLRKLLRVRRIANLRLRRLLEERNTNGPDTPIK